MTNTPIEGGGYHYIRLKLLSKPSNFALDWRSHIGIIPDSKLSEVSHDFLSTTLDNSAWYYTESETTGSFTNSIGGSSSVYQPLSSGVGSIVWVSVD